MCEIQVKSKLQIIFLPLFPYNVVLTYKTIAYLITIVDYWLSVFYILSDTIQQ